MKIIPVNIRNQNHNDLKCLVDDDDYEIYSPFKWHVREVRETGKFHVRRCKYLGGGRDNQIRQWVWLHRAIIKAPKGFSVDHIDGNGLNNQKSNLRICEHVQNQWNQEKHKDGTSRFKGVYKCPTTGAWAVKLSCRGVKIWIGRFDDEIDAALAWNEAAKKYHGKFARLNVIED